MPLTAAASLSATQRQFESPGALRDERRKERIHSCLLHRISVTYGSHLEHVAFVAMPRELAPDTAYRVSERDKLTSHCQDCEQKPLRFETRDANMNTTAAEDLKNETRFLATTSCPLRRAAVRTT